MDNPSALRDLLVIARRLNNQCVRDAREVEEWHRSVDDVLSIRGDPEPEERWDNPKRVEHRAFLARLFNLR